MDQDQLAIKRIVEKRDIEWLCHFTPVENLDNIRKNGLKLRHALSRDEVKVTDSSRFDPFSNSICLSISKPNDWMLRKKLSQGFELCLLLIDPAVLYEKKCLFYPHNAATKSYRYMDENSLMGDVALEALFDKEITYQKSGYNPTTLMRERNLFECETTSSQAEVQCLETIEPRYIKRIIMDDIDLTYYQIRSFVRGRSDYRSVGINNNSVSEKSTNMSSIISGFKEGGREFKDECNNIVEGIKNYHKVVDEEEKKWRKELGIKSDHKVSAVSVWIGIIKEIAVILIPIALALIAM
ncbi:hypothetical protein A1D22_10085 [Pasteurellaceae bacterium LFhippo2]|nr:hypothetical protein [Pasteurellaceae bacterium LFhippo2]